MHHLPWRFKVKAYIRCSLHIWKIFNVYILHLLKIKFPAPRFSSQRNYHNIQKISVIIREEPLPLKLPSYTTAILNTQTNFRTLPHIIFILLLFFRALRENLYFFSLREIFPLYIFLSVLYWESTKILNELLQNWVWFSEWF